MRHNIYEEQKMTVKVVEIEATCSKSDGHTVDWLEMSHQL